jgi:hypothetical protein
MTESTSQSRSMTTYTAKELFIQGITHDGKVFRPTDWAERLAGVMSQFRPGGPQPGSHLSYSPWCLPTNLGDIKCVIVNRDIRALEPMAWDFVMNFAKDNNLVMMEATSLPADPTDLSRMNKPPKPVKTT